MYLSLVIPAFNEEKKIQKDMEAALAYLSTKAGPSEVLLVNDGSRDRTAEKIESLIPQYNTPTISFRLLQYGKNRGKGYAIRYGVEQAQGSLIAFADSGLCVPFSFLDRGLEKIREGADYAIATRRHPEAQILIEQPIHRRWGSQVFWWVVQAGMGVHVSDTQCGFKVYTGGAAKRIFSKVKTDGFMFDIEALIVAKRLGLRGAEFPVEWSNDSDTRYHPIWGTIRNFRELLKIRIRSLQRKAF